ncbi:MAG TPA: NAD(P)-binding domain-containing protein [Acetobacteraceae bacterium]|nr:NAD(P)-binding domain-containing protein [Acetobacteraceae bacterium]
MSYAIVGFGAVGQALARMFARKGIEVAVASSRPPQALAPQANAIGPTIVPKTLQDALEADIVILAVPYWQHREVAKARSSWQGKIVIDVTNSLDDLGGVPSSAVIARTLPGAQLVKAFNHLPARVLAEDPASNGGRRVVFLSSDDDSATATVAALAEQLGYAPVSLGKIAEGGQLVQGRDKSWAPLIFQDLFKKEPRAMPDAVDQRPPVAIGHVSLHVTDIGAASHWLATVGLRPIVSGSDLAVLELRGGTHLVVVPAGQPPEPRTKAPFDLMFDDIDATHRIFAERGLSPSPIRRGRIHDSFEIVGPDGWMFTINSSHASGQPV